MQYLFQLTTEEFSKLLSDVVAEKLTQFLAIKIQQEENNTKELLKTKDVAAIFKVSERTIANWKKSGKLNDHLVGGSVFFKPSDVEKAMISREKPIRKTNTKLKRLI